MKTMYIDCQSGVSGDMFLGALVDSGVDLGQLQSGIDSLGLPQCRLRAETVKRRGFRGLKIHVDVAEEKSHRHLHHITRMIDGSQLNERQKDLAKRIFGRLAEAEARVHGTTIEKVHFHEVGAADSIADIVGSAIGVEQLGVDTIVCSPVPTGSGFVHIEHGRVSVPAPATAELLKGVPIAESSVQAELTTPTGAAIVSTLAQGFGPLPRLAIHTIGVGAGSRDFPEQPNLLRILLGANNDCVQSDSVSVLETNLDDLGGEIVGHCTQLLMDAGALDVYTTAIQMKKNRPAVKLTVLCHPSEASRLETLIFRETSSLGVRHWSADRHILARQSCQVATRWGLVEGKLATQPDGATRFSPEYESCRRIAEQHGIPLQLVYQESALAYVSNSQSQRPT